MRGVTPPGGTLSTDAYAYPVTSNRVQTITRGASTVRQITYDNAGNILTDNRLGTTYNYTYNARNRLAGVTAGALPFAYGYNALEQLVTRQQTAGPSQFTTHFVHDIFGNIIAETGGGGATGSTGTVREYIWLPETEIAPTSSSRTTIDRPLAVVDLVNTASPQTWWVSVDHLNRPVKMTNASRASVWDAVWLPWGGVHSITGSASLDTGFPGQWFQAESGLHYNWHRSYDPSLGRYTQPDPLGFVDGPNVYGYGKGNPNRWVDPDGRDVDAIGDAAIIVFYSRVIAACLRGVGQRIITVLKSPRMCPPCSPYPSGTIGYIGPHLDHDDHPVGRPHVNLFSVNQDLQTCKCFWNKADPDVAAPPVLPGWVDLNSGFPPLSP